ncbi:TetR family transcriptional regulator [Dictyobacter alpinus]|uniref:TetR family transcriptional regulator n=1 Tax=Dictyobacter alpinus TaxID=2014873 RepID=A0A402B0H7_9CHLR|nr:TetR/AcrR family transcriptional regulator [Dictyobacter alpinus]GCE24853.1 TetR family transcriptional regulator [Dictyobacter alpinus]
MRTKDEQWSLVVNLFGDNGYRSTSMRDIARTLDLSEAHVHALLGSKEDMLWHIVSRVARLFLSQARTVPRSISPAEQLHLLIYRHLELVSQDKDYVLVFLRDWTLLDDIHRQEVQSMRETYDAYFYRVIDAGVKEGIFNVPDTLLACLFVLSALQWTHQWFTASDALTFVQLVDQYSAFILRALCSDYTLPLDGAMAYLYHQGDQTEQGG